MADSNNRVRNQSDNLPTNYEKVLNAGPIERITMQFSKILVAATVAASVQAANNSSSSSSGQAGALQAGNAVIGAGLAVAGAAALLL
ncbi:hypothetical protein FOB63_002618 [Clavispora lusitaniae]|uniref:uncharacterized protein n=1 Tax=Clavispora lusitaniae TaxID=36911 RepID=UPI00202C914E|nr:hypothetical protein FOB63_002618 [Clavispora lusitaniae]